MTDLVQACQISTIGGNVRTFFRGQLGCLHEHGFRYTVITSDPSGQDLLLPPEARYVSVRLNRGMSPGRDLLSLLQLYRALRRGHFDLVQYTTPKAALLGSIAAFLARVPVRLYLMWGTYYVTRRGLSRRFFKFMERVICTLSTHISPDSCDTRQFILAEGLARQSKTSVVGAGSANGINLELFDPERWAASRQEIRAQWGIPANATVIGSVMRIMGDKGINELVAAFALAAEERPDLYLLIVGPAESKDPPSQQTLQIMDSNSHVIRTGPQGNVAGYYAAMDVFCLPTYREGFGVVNLEAAAMALPVITTDAVGARGSILDGQNGLLVPTRNVPLLEEAMLKLAGYPELRARMGRAGREWVAQHFEQKAFWRAVLAHRQGLLIARGSFVRQGEGLARR